MILAMYFCLSSNAENTKLNDPPMTDTKIAIPRYQDMYTAIVLVVCRIIEDSSVTTNEFADKPHQNCKMDCNGTLVLGE